MPSRICLCSEGVRPPSSQPWGMSPRGGTILVSPRESVDGLSFPNSETRKFWTASFLLLYLVVSEVCVHTELLSPSGSPKAESPHMVHLF